MQTATSPSIFRAFTYSRISGAIATVADFSIVFLLVEAFHVWYVVATGLGSLAGGITNFIIDRNWSFNATNKTWYTQAPKYTLVSVGSAILNSSGTYLLTEFVHLHYAVSVIIVAITIGVFFNFPLQRCFVFK